MQSQVKSNRVPEKVPEKVPGSLDAEPGQVQEGSEEGSGEGPGSFGAEPGRFNRVPEKEQGSGEGLGGFGAGPGLVPEKVGEALVQSQVRFNRFPKQVPEKVSGVFGAEPGQV